MKEIKKKLETNWKQKTLENLEKKIWPSINLNEVSHLIRTCNLLRKKNYKISQLKI